MKLYKGKIADLYLYFGIIKFKDDNSKAPRLIPFFFKNNKGLYIGAKVEFEICLTDKRKVRGEYLKFAKIINIISRDINKNGPVKDIDRPIDIINQNLEGYEIKDEKALNTFRNENGIYDSEDYLSYLMKNLKEPISVEKLKSIIKQDKKLKAFVLKWVLYLEAKVRNEIITELIEEGYTLSKLNDQVNANLKKIIKKSLKNVGSNYLLKTSPNNIKYELSKDPKYEYIPKAREASFDEVLSCFTLGELLILLRYLQKNNEAFQSTSWSEIYECMANIKPIRNIAAHGDDFISLILDWENNPNALLQKNSKIYGRDKWYPDKEKDDRIFNTIRSPLHLVMKGNIQNSQDTAVKISQILLGNPTLLGLLYLFYLMNKDNLQKEDFNNEFSTLLGDGVKIIDLIEFEKRDSENNRAFWDKINEMFNYIKQEGLEYESCFGNEVYYVFYPGNQIAINLNDNALWITKLLLKDKEEFSNKAGFLFENDNYSKLKKLFSEIYVQKKNPLESLKNFESLQEIFNVVVGLSSILINSHE